MPFALWFTLLNMFVMPVVVAPSGVVVDISSNVSKVVLCSSTVSFTVLKVVDSNVLNVDVGNAS